MLEYSFYFWAETQHVLNNQMNKSILKVWKYSKINTHFASRASMRKEVFYMGKNKS